MTFEPARDLEATPRDFSALTQGNDYIFKKFRADAELAAAAAKAPDGQPLSHKP